jgi:hypothetical protein
LEGRKSNINVCSSREKIFLHVKVSRRIYGKILNECPEKVILLVKENGKEDRGI